MFTKLVISVIIFFIASSAFSQRNDSLSLQLYAEIYGSVIPNQPFNNSRPAYHYNYTKANNAGLNPALAKLHYSTAASEPTLQ
ncbi:MAG: hypothetical protein K2X48_10925 [Chitinophagaceae bacterium]|nr:hypothetical protein [Chitinophagaceae bacterium]